MKIQSWLVAIGSLYLISLTLPVWSNGPQTLWGFQCLIIFPFAAVCPAWWANVLLPAGLICLANRKIFIAWTLGLISIVLAGSFALMVEPEGLRIGYYAWSGCMVGLVVASFDRRYSGDFAKGSAQTTSSPSGVLEGSSSASSSSDPLSSRSPS